MSAPNHGPPPAASPGSNDPPIRRHSAKTLTGPTIDRRTPNRQSWSYVSRGRGRDCTGGHLAAFSKILGWEAEFPPVTDPDQPGSGAGGGSVSRASSPNWPSLPPTPVVVQAAAAVAAATASAAAATGAALALSPPASGGAVGAPAQQALPFPPPSPVGFKRAETSELGAPHAPPKRLRPEVSDTTTAPAQSPPASYVAADVVGEEGDMGAAGAGPAAVAFYAVPAGEGAAATQPLEQLKQQQQPVPSPGVGVGGEDRISDELRPSSASAASSEGAPSPATAAAVGAGAGLHLPVGPPVLGLRHHVGVPLPPLGPEQPPPQPPPPQQQQRAPAQGEGAGGAGAVAAAVEGGADSPPRPRRTGIVTSPIPILPPMSGAGPEAGAAAFASCGVAWMYSEEEEAQGFPAYLEVSCCPNFSAHFLGAEELRALIELGDKPIEQAWGRWVGCWGVRGGRWTGV